MEACGMGFMFAPINHPAMRVVAPIRKALGVRTVFNLLGPMTNAAGAQHVVVGVFTEELMDLMVRAARRGGKKERNVVSHMRVFHTCCCLCVRVCFRVV